MMVRWMCGIHLKSKTAWYLMHYICGNDEARWFGDVERKDRWVSVYRSFEVNGVGNSNMDTKLADEIEGGRAKLMRVLNESKVLRADVE